MKAWAQTALSHLRDKGGTGLLTELMATRATPDAALAAPLQSLANYVVFREDACRIRTGSAPHVLSVVRNAAMFDSWLKERLLPLLRILNVDNIAAAVREHTLKLPLLLYRLRIR
jgi:hypothetical protein